jgi:hypothetical protein
LPAQRGGCGALCAGPAAGALVWRWARGDQGSVRVPSRAESTCLRARAGGRGATRGGGAGGLGSDVPGSLAGATGGAARRVRACVRSAVAWLPRRPHAHPHAPRLYPEIRTVHPYPYLYPYHTRGRTPELNPYPYARVRPAIPLGRRTVRPSPQRWRWRADASDGSARVLVWLWCARVCLPAALRVSAELAAQRVPSTDVTPSRV